MKQRPSLLKTVATAAGMWLAVGVPVAAVVAAFRVFVWVIFGLPEMMVTAAALGAVQGLWLYLVGRPSTENRGLEWFSMGLGGVLGLLGFPPVMSRIDGVVVDRLMVAVFLLAAFCGGIAAGFVSTSVVAVPLRNRSTLVRAAGVGCLLVLLLAVLDYRFFWTEAADRLPVAQVSNQAIANISAGDARGSTWSGCYQ